MIDRATIYRKFFFPFSRVYSYSLSKGKGGEKKEAVYSRRLKRYERWYFGNIDREYLVVVVVYCIHQFASLLSFFFFYYLDGTKSLSM